MCIGHSPLQWPDGWPRTAHPRNTRLVEARAGLMRELQRLGASQIVSWQGVARNHCHFYRWPWWGICWYERCGHSRGGGKVCAVIYPVLRLILLYRS